MNVRFTAAPPWAGAGGDITDVSYRGKAVPPRMVPVIPESVVSDARGRAGSGVELWLCDRRVRSGDVMGSDGRPVVFEGSDAAFIFFADLHPDELWEHPCEYWVYVNGAFSASVSATAPPALGPRKPHFYRDTGHAIYR